jgi:hypothetical protein
MVRICFHALIITGGTEKVNQKYYFYQLLGAAIATRHTTASAIEKAHAGVGLVGKRRK